MLTRLLSPLLLVLVLGFASLQPSRAADLFGKPDATNTEQTQPQIPDAIAPALPEPLRGVLAAVVGMQRDLNTTLRGHLRAARDGGGWAPALAIIGVSFLYGVFHAVGPGHGKVVVGSYFLTRRARLLHGLAMSGSAALVQALSAILLVSILALLLDAGSRQIMDQAALLEYVSYAGICALGLWMAWGVISGRTCCDHDHDDPGHGHDDHHHDEACGCGHDHHDHAPTTPPPSRRPELLQVLLTGGAVGLRPCSGAILVLLFTLANGIFPVGVLSTFAMGLGVAITVSAVSLGMVGLQRSLAHLGANHATQKLRQALALAGAAAITLLGAAQLYGLWSGLIPAIAG